MLKATGSNEPIRAGPAAHGSMQWPTDCPESTSILPNLKPVTAADRSLNETSNTSRRRPMSRWRRFIFRLAAVLVIPTLFFSAMEIGLRIMGTGYPAAFVVPLPQKPGYLVDNYKFAWRFFPKSLARSSQPILVAQNKPPASHRIIVLGGSAAMGDPESAFGFPRVLQALLRLRYPEQEFEVINAAVTAVNSNVVLPIAKDCRVMEADAWIVYMGNNEVHGPFGAGTVFGGHDTPLWLNRAGLAAKRTKIGQLLARQWSSANAGSPKPWGGMEMFLDHQLRHDDPSVGKVYDHFQRNLNDILATAQRTRTPVLFSTVVTNLRDCAPFGSLHDEALSKEELTQWQQWFEKGCSAQAEGRFADAIEAFQQASRVDAEFAELQYRLGKCFLQQSQPEKAREAFRLARDYDGLRFRADSTINDILRAVAETQEGQGTWFIDASDQFAQRSPDGIVGEEFLLEHVHFNFAGNYLLAKLFATQLAEVLNLDEKGAPSGDWPSQEECANRLGLTPYHRLLIAKEMKGRLRSAPFNRQSNRQARDDRLQAELSRLTAAMTADAAHAAINQFQQLLSEDPGDWTLRAQFSVLLESTEDLDGAAQQWVEITNQLPHYAEGYYKLGTLFNRLKRWDEAEQSLRRALSLRPEYARASNSLGICLSHLGQFQQSYDQFAKAVQLRPNYAEAYANWGLVLANQGSSSGAVNRHRDAVEADRNYIPAHLWLAKHFLDAEEYDEALKHYSEVVRMKPADAGTRVNLGLLYLKANRPMQAVEHLERAVQLDPNSRLAQQALGQARKLSEEVSP